LNERRLLIPQHLLQSILEHCLDEKPFEACGILTGRAGRVLHAYATDNSKRSPVYYEVEQAQQERVLHDMAERGEELVGIYHSHPTAPAEPSGSDIRLAVHYPDVVRVIISLSGPTSVKAYLIQDGVVWPVRLDSPHQTQGAWHDVREAASDR
jgi:proteasome lid subunit RPN8/RPN11